MSKKISAQKYVEYYKEVFASEAGQIVLADLVKRYRVLRPFPMNKRNAGDLEFCEGQRQVVIDLLTKMNYDLNKLNELLDMNQVEVNYERGH